MKNVAFSYYMERRRGKKEYPLHKHECHELVYYDDAGGVAIVEGKEYPITPGMLAVIPANHLHTDRYSQTSTIYCLNFFSDTLLTIDFLQDEEREFLALFQALGREMKQKSAFREEIILHFVNIILLKYEQHREVPNEKTYYSSVINEAAQYIRSNYSAKIDFHELAAVSGYSYDHFRMLFQKAHGCTPKHYLLTVRIERARYLLRNTDELIKNIALECGFGQASAFANSFRELTGESPAEYRVRIQNENKK